MLCGSQHVKQSSFGTANGGSRDHQLSVKRRLGKEDNISAPFFHAFRYQAIEKGSSFTVSCCLLLILNTKRRAV